MRVQEYKKKQIKTLPEEKRADLVKKLRKEHEKMVKGMFEFVDAGGGWFDFSYRFFKEDLLATYHFIHGEVVEIPLGLVRHINNTMRKIRVLAPEQDTRGIKWQAHKDKNGNVYTYEKTSRIRFVRMDDIEAPSFAA